MRIGDWQELKDEYIQVAEGVGGSALLLRRPSKLKDDINMVIAISGKKGAGKTYQAKEIQQNISKEGFLVEILSIAEPIKEIVNLLLVDKEVEDYKRRPEVISTLNCTAREALQKVGTVLKDTLSESLWIDLLIEKIKSSEADFIVIDDLRFDAELKALEECFCEVGHIHIDYKHQDTSDTHISENSITITDDTLVIERY